LVNFTRLHGVTFQKTVLFKVTAVGTSNPKYLFTYLESVRKTMTPVLYVETLALSSDCWCAVQTPPHWETVPKLVKFISQKEESEEWQVLTSGLHKNNSLLKRMY
jgi:hypothetical protein